MGTLYRFECAKLLQKKLVWVCLALCMALTATGCLAEFFGDTVIDGVVFESIREANKKNLAYARKLDGRAVDQDLLEEMTAAYRSIPQELNVHYTATEEYQKNARPYSVIFNLVRHTTSMQSSQIMFTWEPDEQEYYALFREGLRKSGENQYLTEGELAFWEAASQKIEQPLVYKEQFFYDKLASMYQTVALLVLMLQAVCLSGMFSDEHVRKTDQLNLCTVMGKTKLYWAKLLAGVSFALVVSGVCTLAAALIVAAAYGYGIGGGSCAFQFIYPYYSGKLNCAQAMAIAYGVLAVTAAFYGVMIMYLSERLKSSVAALAIGTSLLIAGMMVSVPDHLRLIRQIWDWLPSNFLMIWNLFSGLTLPVPGGYLTAWQAAPLLYILAGGGIVLLGKRCYRRYQVSGR